VNPWNNAFLSRYTSLPDIKGVGKEVKVGHKSWKNSEQQPSLPNH